MTLERGWWDEPVPVALRGVAAITKVNNTRQAADVLINKWPTAPGPKHLAARKAVLRAMKSALDAKQQAEARKAFAEAAKEAGIDVPG